MSGSQRVDTAYKQKLSMDKNTGKPIACVRELANDEYMPCGFISRLMSW